MGVVGFNLTKINVERKKFGEGKVSIDNNLSLKDLTERNLGGIGKTKQMGIDFGFEFKVQYLAESKETFASMSLEGDVLYVEEATKVKALVEDWKKNKNVDKEILTQVMNMAMAKCNIAAIMISREINMPPPIPLPKVRE